MNRRLRVLFVCAMNKQRSLTAEQLYRNDTRLEVRSAGVRSEALVRPRNQWLIGVSVRLRTGAMRHIDRRCSSRPRFTEIAEPISQLILIDLVSIVISRPHGATWWWRGGDESAGSEIALSFQPNLDIRSFRTTPSAPNLMGAFRDGIVIGANRDKCGGDTHTEEVKPSRTMRNRLGGPENADRVVGAFAMVARSALSSEELSYT